MYYRVMQFLIMLGCAVSLPSYAQSETAFAFNAGDPALQWENCVPSFPPGCKVVALHGDISKPNVDIFFKVEPGYQIPLHWHSSPERMILISGKVSLTYEGQEANILMPGDYNYGPGGVKHYGVCLSDEPCVIFIAFQETIDVFTEQDE